MKEQAVARRYARALFDLGQERQNLPQLVDEYSGVLEVLDQHSELRKVLEHPLMDVQSKRQLIDRIFGGRIDPLLHHLLLLLVEKRREDQIKAVFASFRELADRDQAIAEVHVTTAAPLAAQSEHSLEEVLTSYLGKKIRMVTALDQSLLGGVVVQIGDRRIDGSLRTRLRTIQAAISGREST